MVCGRVDHSEQTVNLPTKGHSVSHNKFNARLYNEDQRVVLRTRRKHNQQHIKNSNGTAETTGHIGTTPRHCPLNTRTKHTRTPPRRSARMHSNRSSRFKAREVRWQQSQSSKSLETSTALSIKAITSTDNISSPLTKHSREQPIGLRTTPPITHTITIHTQGQFLTTRSTCTDCKKVEK